jgi:hypothetical protein
MYSVQALRKYQNGESTSLSPVYKASLIFPYSIGIICWEGMDKKN